jgi:hypothetical protein
MKKGANLLIENKYNYSGYRGKAPNLRCLRAFHTRQHLKFGNITMLTGVLPDQAAVQGVLQKLYNLGFPLILAEKVETLTPDSQPHL